MLSSLLLLLCLLATLTGCDAWTQKDQAGTVAGPGITVHCDALTPGAVGDSTVKVNCPDANP